MVAVVVPLTLEQDFGRDSTIAGSLLSREVKGLDRMISESRKPTCTTCTERSALGPIPLSDTDLSITRLDFGNRTFLMLLKYA